jgi:hypothetical protein
MERPREQPRSKARINVGKDKKLIQCIGRGGSGDRGQTRWTQSTRENGLVLQVPKRDEGT